MRLSLLFASLAVLAANAFALEISLEENRMKRGGVGFVDIRKVYEELPETRRAKEEFEGEVKKRDSELQQKRRELRALRDELRRLEGEYEFLKMTPIQVDTAPAAAVSTATLAEAAPGAESEASARTPSPVQGAATPAAPVAAPEPAPISTAPVSLPGLPGFEQAPSGIPGTPEPGAGPSLGEDRAERLRRLEEQVRTRKDAVAAAEKELKSLGGRLEGELSRLEGDKSRALLGRIYRTLQRLAREDGVSVVVDKGSILFGHEAVDFTDRLIDELKKPEAAAP